jgi:hypothetical protein
MALDKGGLFAEGILMCLDGQARYVREGEQCFLRLQNFQNQGDFQEVGVPYVPTGTGSAANQTGYTDILIDPPPETTDQPDRDVGIAGGKIMFGARTFLVSYTFIRNMRDQYPGLQDDSDIWRNWDGNTPVIGIIYSQQLFSIESVTSRELGGQTISYVLNCVGSENYLLDGSQESVVP